MTIEAYQIAEVIQLKKFRSDYTSPPLDANNSELFYKQDTDRYFYLFSYGVVAFAGFNDLEKSTLLKFIRTYAEDEVAGDYREDFEILVNPDASVQTTYNAISLPELTDEGLRIVMLNVAQSVALDYYEDLGLGILTDTKRLTDQLERVGRLPIAKTALLKFIGKTLNIKNSIIDNLYIFDAPDSVWENELLGRIDEGLKKTLDLRMRYRDVDYKLKIVQENLTLFTEFLQNRESTRLEWIIILLILIEVGDLVVRWFF
jgi:uncharacterized Rmd1/YagE family protein